MEKKELYMLDFNMRNWFYSILFVEIAIIGGIISSFYLDIAPGGTIVIISIIEFLLVSLISKYKKINNVKVGLRNKK